MNGQSAADAIPLAIPESPSDRLAVLFDDHHDRLFLLARRLTSSRDAALDLLQETFLKAARFPASIPVGFSNEEAWLVRVLVNTRRDEWRKAAVRKRLDTDAGPSVCVDNGPEAALIARDTVWRALETLTLRQLSATATSNRAASSLARDHRSSASPLSSLRRAQPRCGKPR